MPARPLYVVPGYDVGTAALSVGFKTHAHFSRVYKNHFNSNPSFTDK